MFRQAWLVVATLALGGCRIVSQQELADLKNPPNPAMAQVNMTWQQKIVPQIVREAKPVTEMMRALSAEKDFDSACKSLGYRSQEENPCVFSVRIVGRVTAVDTRSRNGKMTVRDTGGQDVVVRTGPIIPGTALRDVYKGISYQDFNDQVLFGDYGRAINKLASEEIQKLQPKVGDSIEVDGVFSSWDIPQTPPDVTPAHIANRGRS